MSRFTLILAMGFLVKPLSAMLEGQNPEGPHKPTLYLQREVTVFVRGEPLELVCVARTSTRVHVFALFQGSEGRELRSQRAKSWSLSVISEVQDIVENGTQNFTCSYWSWESGRRIMSARSESLVVTVIDPLSKPVLTLNVRTGVYRKGQVMRMTCAGDVRELHSLYYFYRDGQPATTGEPNSFQTVHVQGTNRAGQYQCRPALDLAGTWFQSSFSEPVNVTEIESDYLRLRNMVSLADGICELL